MHIVLAAVRGFAERFPDAALFLVENNIQVIAVDALAEMTQEEKAKVFPEVNVLWVAAEICNRQLLSQFPKWE